VFGIGPRIAAALGSGIAAIVIIGGAMWSAWRLFRQRRNTVAPGRLSPARLALANLFIAFGTLVLSAGGLLNSVVDEMNGFALSLVAGISVIFVGFLITNSGPRSALSAVPEPVAWHAPRAEVA
jgi:hypothetical protein